MQNNAIVPAPLSFHVYVIQAEHVAGSQYVVQESTEAKSAMQLFAEAVVSSTEELKEARDYTHKNLSIFNRNG